MISLMTEADADLKLLARTLQLPHSGGDMVVYQYNIFKTKLESYREINLYDNISCVIFISFKVGESEGPWWSKYLRWRVSWAW